VEAVRNYGSSTTNTSVFIWCRHPLAFDMIPSNSGLETLFLNGFLLGNNLPASHTVPTTTRDHRAHDGRMAAAGGLLADTHAHETHRLQRQAAPCAPTTDHPAGLLPTKGAWTQMCAFGGYGGKRARWGEAKMSDRR
jgi:hypothetical protein